MSKSKSQSTFATNISRKKQGCYYLSFIITLPKRNSFGSFNAVSKSCSILFLYLYRWHAKDAIEIFKYYHYNNVIS